MTRILVDDRERQAGVMEALAELDPRTQVDVQRLKWGDYQVYPDTLVERKTVDDFCMSLIDGRLFRQAYWLVQCTGNPLVLIEGSWPERIFDVDDAAIHGALLTLAQTFRLPVIYTRDPGDTASTLLHLAQQRRRVGTNRGKLCGRRPKTLIKQKSYALQALPGVGRHLAEELLEHFGSVRGVVSSSAEDLQEVAGMGPKRAARIVDVVSEQAGRYVATAVPDSVLGRR